MEQENNQYIMEVWNRKRNLYRLKLGVEQMIQHPLLIIFLIPIIVLTVYFWVKVESVLAFSVDVPKLLVLVFTIVIKALGILIPLLLLFLLIDTVGTFTAKKDEARLQMAFRGVELRNGSPILMHKKKDKKSGVTVREFYSPLPLKLWQEYREEIADAMNIHFVQDFRYGGKANGNRIVMCSAEGREPTSRGILYDEEF